MALPTIATNWSGNVDFMRPDNSLPLKVNGLVEVPGSMQDTPFFVPPAPPLSKIQSASLSLHDQDTPQPGGVFALCFLKVAKYERLYQIFFL